MPHMSSIQTPKEVRKELGGCLISYDIQHAYTGKLGVHHHYSVSPIYVGIELLWVWQLRRVR